MPTNLILRKRAPAFELYSNGYTINSVEKTSEKQKCVFTHFISRVIYPYSNIILNFDPIHTFFIMYLRKKNLEKISRTQKKKKGLKTHTKL